MITRVFLSALAGAVVMFLLGFLIYGVLLDAYMKSLMLPEAAKLMKEMPNLVMLFISNFAFCWLYAFVFERWAGIKTFASGMTGGVLMAVPVAIGIDLNMASTMNLMNSYLPIVIDVVAIAIMSAISGGVIGQVLGMLGKKPAEA